MTVPQLKYFCKLAEVQHYTRAAKELFISQPSLSSAIRSLESELDFELFHKKGRNVVLTKAGWDFYQYASKSLDILESGIEISRKNIEEQTNNIDLSMNMVSSEFVAGIYADFKSRAGKNIEFSIIEGDCTERVMDSVSIGISDVGFCGKVDNRDDLEFVPVFYRKTLAVVQNNHPLAKEKSISLKQLKPYRLITYLKTMNAGKKIAEVLEQNDLNAEYKYSSVNVLCTLCKGSSNVGVLFDTHLLRQYSDLCFIPITDVPYDFLPICMIYEKSRFRSHACQMFIDFVRSEYEIQ